MPNSSMRAILKTDPIPRSISLQLVPRPHPRPGEALVRIVASGICSTDAAIYGSTYRGRQPVPIPCILGHEAAGEVVAVGPDVDRVQSGDRVALEAVIPCRKCGVCRRGLTNICPNWQHVGASAVGGTFADFVALPASLLHRLPHEVGWDDAALIEPLSVAVHGLSLAEHSVGDPLVVVGPGPLGLAFALLGIAAGMSPVIVIGCAGVDEARLEIARRLGATALATESAEHVAGEVRRLLDAEARGVFVEAGGAPGALQTVLDTATPGSDVLLVGFPIEATIKPFAQVLRKGLRLSAVGASRGEHFTAAIAAAVSGVRLSQIISHRLPLADVADGMELFLSKTAAKVLIEI